MTKSFAAGWPLRVRFAAAAVALLTLATATPAAAAAQGPTPIGVAEDSLTATDWAARARAVVTLADRPTEITAAGLTRLIALLDGELAGTMPVAGADDDESYAQYIMQLTALVTRFNDPRATPLLARQGIAINRGAVFQVAMAGDRAIAPLLETWTLNAALRPAVIRTLGEMRHYADSTDRSLSTTTRATIDDYLLRASAAEEPWVRQAFVTAVLATRDPQYLPLISGISASDPATIDGTRYVAADAAPLVPLLEQRRAAASPPALLRSLRDEVAAVCRLSWIADGGICVSLDAKLAAAAASLDRSQPAVAGNQLNAFQSELAAQRGKSVGEGAFTLLSENAGYLASRL